MENHLNSHFFSMIRIQTRISDGLDVLQFFTMRKWDFKSDNFAAIMSYLSPKDQETYVNSHGPLKIKISNVIFVSDSTWTWTG